jgi:hypothetical protein
MFHVEQDTINPWEALGMAVGKQQGPDGKWMVSLHMGTMAMSVAAVLPADSIEETWDQMGKDIRKAAMECRLSNKGVITKNVLA